LRCTCGTPLGGSPLAGCSQPRCIGDETKKPLTCLTQAGGFSRRVPPLIPSYQKHVNSLAGCVG
jgi:hypothetical protein